MQTMTLERSNPEATARAIQWIKDILDEKQISGTKLALQSGLAPSTLLRMVNDKNHRFTPTLKTLQAVSTSTMTPIPEAILHAHNIGGSQLAREEMSEREMRRVGGGSSVRVSGRQQVENQPARKIPVKPVSGLPKALQPALRQEVRVECPRDMEEDATAFAFYQPDNSLEPLVRGGMLMYATKKRSPLAGDMVLVTDDNGRSRVRIIHDISGDGIELVKGVGAFDEPETVAFDDLEDLAIVQTIKRF